MTRKIHYLAGIIGVLAVLIGLIHPMPLMASETIPNLTEKLDKGWVRLSPTVLQHTVTAVNNKALLEYKISAVANTLPDKVTLIDNQWYQQVDPSGQWWYENGNNTFKARVTANKITVLDAKGRMTVYDSALSIEKTYKGGTPRVADDPITGATRTSLAWDYGKYGDSAVLTRYLRSNNQRLSELWVLTGDPKTSLIFRPNIVEENKYEGAITPIIAFDSAYHVIPVVANGAKGYYVVNPQSLVGMKYPVYIDPTYAFFSTSDAWTEVTNSAYATAWTAASGTVVDGDFPAWVGQSLFAGVYQVNRSFVMFDTSTLPTNLSVMSARAYLYGYLDESTTDFDIVAVSGQPTYPHDPVVVADYNKALYATDSGSGFSTAAGWSITGYNQVVINNVGWINTAGTTKLGFRSSKDIAGIAPIGDELVGFWQEEHGSGFAPMLFVTGTIPLTIPVVVTDPATSINTTMATLNGHITDDGNAVDSVQFKYGTTVAYGLTTSWVYGFVTDDVFDATIAGLSPGTTYHFQASAVNGFNVGFGADASFTTAPLPPAFFTAVGGVAQVSLSWTKGTGANKTVIVRKTGSFPTSITDGTIVYSNTGTNVVDAPLVNGTTYYYSAWSLAADNVTYSLSSVQDSATPLALSTPGVTTGSVSNVGAASATLSGILTSLGGYANTSVWFDYGTTLAYELGPTAPQVLTDLGVFTDNIAGLPAATLIHFRAVAQNGSGTTNGGDVTFTTGGNSAPTMTTNAATGIQITAAQLNGTVTSDGGSPPVTVWFRYGLTTQYELGSTNTAAGLIAGDTFYYGVANLLTNTTYHYQAVGQNALGTSYGGDQSFITLTATTPTVITNPATSVGAVQATLQGTLSIDGGVTDTLSFEWGPTVAYGNPLAATPSTGTSGTAFSAILSGLVTGTTYHFRAKATNNGGTGNGADQTFTTVFAVPTNFLAVAISSDTINLSWTPQGDQTFISYKTTGYPVNRADGTGIFFGPESVASVAGLVAGTTYYFSAWSWKTGDIWTTSNANAVATTFAASQVGVLPPPTVLAGQNPSTPSTWFDIPTNAVVRNFPLYGVVTGWGTAYQIPEGTFWALVSLFTSTVFGALVFATWRQAVPAVGTSIVVLLIMGIIQACPPIFIAFIGAIEIGGAYGLMSLGGNIAGRGA